MGLQQLLSRGRLTKLMGDALAFFVSGGAVMAAYGEDTSTSGGSGVASLAQPASKSAWSTAAGGPLGFALLADCCRGCASLARSDRDRSPKKPQRPAPWPPPAAELDMALTMVGYLPLAGLAQVYCTVCMWLAQRFLDVPDAFPELQASGRGSKGARRDGVLPRSQLSSSPGLWRQPGP